jgi:hypothetical protein
MELLSYRCTQTRRSEGDVLSYVQGECVSSKLHSPFIFPHTSSIWENTMVTSGKKNRCRDFDGFTCIQRIITKVTPSVFSLWKWISPQSENKKILKSVNCCLNLAKQVSLPRHHSHLTGHTSALLHVLHSTKHIRASDMTREGGFRRRTLEKARGSWNAACL